MPVGGKIFRTRPDRPWGPPSLIYNGYRVSFPGVKRPGRGVDHPHPSSPEVKERVELYLYSPSEPSWPVLGRTLWPFVPVGTGTQGSVVCIATGWTVRCSYPYRGRFPLPQNLEIGSFAHPPPIYWVSGVGGIKGPGCCIGNWHSSSVEVKNEWSCTAFPLPTFLRGVDRERLTLFTTMYLIWLSKNICGVLWTVLQRLCFLHHQTVGFRTDRFVYRFLLRLLRSLGTRISWLRC